MQHIYQPSYVFDAAEEEGEPLCLSSSTRSTFHLGCCEAHNLNNNNPTMCERSLARDPAASYCSQRTQPTDDAKLDDDDWDEEKWLLAASHNFPPEDDLVILRPMKRSKTTGRALSLLPFSNEEAPIDDGFWYDMELTLLTDDVEIPPLLAAMVATATTTPPSFLRNQQEEGKEEEEEERRALGEDRRAAHTTRKRKAGVEPKLEPLVVLEEIERR